MPLPPFDSNGVLPPHSGDPTDLANISPYACTPLDFARRFSTTPERRIILLGWLELRALLRGVGFAGAFQWVDGSFIEDIEATGSRAPRDVDAVTFYWPTTPDFNLRVAASSPELADHDATKTRWHVDHYFVDLAAHPTRTVDAAAYWCGLFSHRRDGVWKGLLRIELGAESDDAAARTWLQTQQP